MNNDRLAEILGRIPWVMVATVYVAYLAYDFYIVFQRDEQVSPYLAKQAQIQTMDQENKKLDAKVKEAEVFYKTLDKKREEIRKSAIELNQMKTTLSEDLDVASFIKMVVTEAKKVGMNVKGIQPTNEQRQEFYIVQNFDLTFSGVYVQLLTFLERLSNSQRIIRLDNFELRPLGTLAGGFVELEGKLEIQTFKYAGSKADEIANKSQKKEEN